MKKKRLGRAGAADHLPRVKTSQEARELAALGAGRPLLKGGAVRVSVVLGEDQLKALDRLGMKGRRSELLRELLAGWLAQQK